MLKPKVTTAELEALPEEIRQYYKPIDGSDDTHLLQVQSAGGYALENVAPLKSALEKTKKDLKAAEGTLAKFKIDVDGEKQLIDPEEAIRAMEAQASGTEGVEERISAAVKSTTERLNRQHETKIEELTSKLSSTTSELDSMLLTTAGMSAISEAGGNPKFLMPVFKSRARVVQDEEGKRVVEILGEDGTPRAGSGPGGRMTPDELFQELSADEDYAAAFSGGTSTGTGSKPSERKAPSRPGTVSSRDPHALSSSLEDIASGKVSVSD